MAAICFVLGAVSKVNATLWRYRINFVPVSVILVVIAAVAGVALFDLALDGFRRRTPPVPMTVQQIRELPKIKKDFVKVSGVMFPVAVYEFGATNIDGTFTSVEKSWFPLLDRESRRILLVQQAGSVTEGQPHEATITGALREMDGDLRGKLMAAKNTIDGVPVETSCMLVMADESAGNPWTSAVAAALILGLAALFVVATLMRNTVFQPTGGVMRSMEASPSEPVPIGATGVFVLEQQRGFARKRFVQMPAFVVRVDDGGAVVCANIDASSRFMGFTTSKREGIWTLPIDSVSPGDCRTGFLYWGLSRFSALKFPYRDVTDGTKRVAILSAATDEALMTAMALVARGGGRSLASIRTEA